MGKRAQVHLEKYVDREIKSVRREIRRVAHTFEKSTRTASHVADKSPVADVVRWFIPILISAVALYFVATGAP